MKEHLINTPVAIQAFIRPQMLEKQWSIIKQARPKTLIIRSDGPRENVPSDSDMIKKSRSIVEDVDWECDVHRLYYNVNQGLYKMIELGERYIWERFDRCIFLEDDQIPSVSFFRYCEDLLEKYKDDRRIFCIHGVNLCGEWKNTQSDYFFARVPASSGIALWRRSVHELDKELKYKDNEYAKNLIYKQMPWYLKEQFYRFAKKGTYANHRPSLEFYVRYAEVCQNQLVIVPKYNLVSNIGIGEGSTHTANDLKTMPKALQKQYGMKTYELTFPLRNNDFVIPDIDFEKKRERQLGVATRLQFIARMISRAIRQVLCGESKRLIAGIRKRINHSIEK